VYLEVWAARTAALDDAGFAAVYADLEYDPGALRVEEIIPSEGFDLLAGGIDDPNQGTIGRLGGCARLGLDGLGREGSFARVATVKARLLGAGKTVVSAAASTGIYGMAVVGRFENLAPEDVDIENAAFVIISGRRDESLPERKSR
jgi:hypothetical protein